MLRRLLVALATGALLATSSAFPSESLKAAPAGVAILAKGEALSGGLIDLSVRDGAIRGVFEFAGTRISFETRRGPQTPWSLRATDPRTPAYEIDVRFLDENGVPFLIQVGGDSPIDQEWERSYHAALSLVEPDEEEARIPFRFAGKALQALRAANFHSEFAPEHQALLSLAPLVKRALSVEKIADSPETFSPAQTTPCTYRHKIEIHDASCCYNLGRHGATIAWTITSAGSATRAWVTCNHGRCATQMPLKCSWTSSANRCQLSLAPMCSTPYDALSRSGKHNSNDDADIQYGGIRRAYTPSPTAGTCSDAARNDQPTNCY